MCECPLISSNHDLSLCSRFVDLCAHFIARSLQFARARITDPPADEFFKWDIPLLVIGK